MATTRNQTRLSVLLCIRRLLTVSRQVRRRQQHNASIVIVTIHTNPYYNRRVVCSSCTIYNTGVSTVPSNLNSPSMIFTLLFIIFKFYRFYSFRVKMKDKVYFLHCCLNIADLHLDICHLCSIWRILCSNQHSCIQWRRQSYGCRR